MANSFTTQTVRDGERNLAVKLSGVLDTSDLSSTLAVDISSFAADTLGRTPTKFRIDKIQWSISDQLEVQLLWDATADVVAAALVDSGEIEFCYQGGLQNNAGAGITGDLNILTTGWASGTQIFTVYLELVKIY